MHLRRRRTKITIHLDEGPYDTTDVTIDFPYGENDAAARALEWFASHPVERAAFIKMVREA